MHISCKILLEFTLMSFERKTFITLKNRKPSCDTKPTSRLINPAKGEMGIVSEQVLNGINSEIRLITKINQ